MKLAIGSDHAGFRLKARLAPWLRSSAGGRHQVKDVGCDTLDSCDYPDFAASVVLYIFYVNAVAFVTLLLLQTTAAALGFIFPIASVRVVGPHGDVNDRP